MAMDATEIERMIKEALPDAQVEIRDLAGDGNHYAAKRRVAFLQGQDPHPAAPDRLCGLKGNMGGVLHALALQTAAE